MLPPEPKSDDAAASVVLFQAMSGATSARLEWPDGRARHLHSMVRPEEEADLYADVPLWGELLVLVGTALGHHLGGVIPRLPEGARVLLVERYPELAAPVVEALRATLGDRLFTVIGDEGDTAATIAAAVAPALAGGGRVQSLRHPASYHAHRPFYERVLDLVHEAEPSTARARPKVRTQPRRALLFQGGFFAEEELRRGLVASGVETTVFSYGNVRSAIDHEAAMGRVFEEARPDVVFTINLKGVGSDGDDLEARARRHGVPVVAWFVDDPRPILGAHPRAAALVELALCWERAYLPALAAFRQAAWLPLATDPGAFTPAGPAASAVPLGFVGSPMTAMLERIRRQFLWRAELAPVVDAAAAALLAAPDADVAVLLERAAARLGTRIPFNDPRNRTWLGSLAIHTASRMKRLDRLAPLVAAGLQTFGDREDWLALLGPDVRAHDDVPYGTPLAALYRATEISVNVTSCQMPTAANQRVFDVPACGGFVLNDAQPDLGELFGPDETVTYVGAEDLREKVTYYAAHEAERRRVAAAGQKRVLGEHTYAHRVQKILALLAGK